MSLVRFFELHKKTIFNLFFMLFFLRIDQIYAGDGPDVKHIEQKRPRPRTNLQLSDLIADDFEFIRNHPAMLLSNAQAVDQMIASSGVESFLDPYLGVKVKEYKLFSRRNDISKRIIVGNQRSIDQMVDIIHDAACGVHASSVPLLIGESGTGKTEIHRIIREAFKYFSENDPKFYFYNVSWVKKALSHIPEMNKIFRDHLGDLVTFSGDFSPVRLLQDVYLDKINEIFEDQFADQGYTFQSMKLDPKSAYIKKAIIEYYQDNPEDKVVKANLESLGIEHGYFTPEEELKIIDLYIKVKYFSLNDSGYIAVIGFQNPLNDPTPLLVTPNVSVAFSNPEHPCAFNYGKIPWAKFVFLDELLRNDPGFLQFFLDTVRGEITAGANVSFAIDALFIAATNNESNKKLKSGDDALDALSSRFTAIPFNWSIFPDEIAKVLLYMDDGRINMAKLSPETEKHVWEKSDLEFMFPRKKNTIRTHTPSLRVALSHGKGDREVFISPHIMESIANFAALTRMSFSQEEAKALKLGVTVIGDPIFSKPLLRLKFLNNDGRVSKSVRSELCRLSTSLNEGSFGISSSQLTEIFRLALGNARSTEGKTLTLSVLVKSYKEYTAKEFINDVEKRVLWNSYLYTVIQGIALPAMRNDIYRSLNQKIIDNMYEEILSEQIAVDKNPDAKTFEIIGVDELETDRPIDMNRVKKIREYYQSMTGLVLNVNRFNDMFDLKGEKNEGLINAIAQYLQDGLTLPLRTLGSYLHGNSVGREQDACKSTYNNLIAKGYNKVSIISALEHINKNNKMFEN